MFAVAVTFTIEAGAFAGFLDAVTGNAALSLKNEQGCRRFDVCTSPDRPDEVFLYELYDDAAAFETHKTMPHYKVFSDLTAPMVAGKVVRTYTLEPGK
jgi:quinol monooxygenase YgiN